MFALCRPQSSRSLRSGASVVEFALIAPIFFMIILGMIEFGRMAMVQQVITNSAREGARIAVLDGATKQKVKNKVKDYLSSASITGANIKVTPDPPESAGYGESVTVRVTIGFDKVSWLPSPFFLGGKTLQAESVMRRETVE